MKELKKSMLKYLHCDATSEPDKNIENKLCELELSLGLVKHHAMNTYGRD
jgi:hypothetical protein